MTDRQAPPSRRDLLARALAKLDELQSRLHRAESWRNEPIAIIGTSCRLPGADDPDALWQLLVDRTDATREAPRDRWDADAWFDADPEVPGKSYTNRGGFLNRVDGFDAGFFGVAPRDAAGMDPQHRLWLELAYEALERAGRAPRSLRGSNTGVFIGVTASDYAQLRTAHDAEHLDQYFLTGSNACFGAGRVAYVLGLHGPAIATDTACSSSLTAVHLACQSLRLGECDLAIAGGVNLMLTPHGHVVMSKARMLSPTGRCRPFSDTADGMVRAEGGAALVLSRLSRAVTCGDPVLAVIRATALNHDGRASGITVPNEDAQVALLESALREAGLRPDQIGYVEAHGTGTHIGDPIEVGALTRALTKGRTADNPLLLGGIKANLGHLESASAAAALIKVVEVLQRKQVPAQLDVETLNRRIDWSGSNIRVPTELTEWPAATRIAGISSFGASGTNAHAIVESHVRDRPAADAPPDAPVLIRLSARTPAALAETTRRLDAFVTAHPDVDLRDVAHTLHVGRDHFEYRTAMVVTSPTALRARLELCGKRRLTNVGNDPAVQSGLHLAWFFGMAPTHCGTIDAFCAHARSHNEELRACDDEVIARHGRTAQHLLQDGPTSSSSEHLAVAHSLARARVAMFRAWGIGPNWVAGVTPTGHVLALCAAGHIDRRSGLVLLNEIAEEPNTDGRRFGRVALHGDAAIVREIINTFDEVTVEVVLGPNHTVAHGPVAMVDAACALAETSAVRTRALGFAAPRTTGARLARVAATLPRRSADAPDAPTSSYVLDPFDATQITRFEEWTRFDTEPIRVDRMIEALLAQRANHVVAQPSLTSILRKTEPRLNALPWGANGPLDALAALYEAGHHVATDVTTGRRIALPTYPFQRSRHWAAPKLAKGHDQGETGDRWLGRRTSLANGAEVFTARWSTTDWPFLGDHEIGDVVVVPAAMLIEFARSAVVTSRGPGFVVSGQFEAALALTNGDAEVQLSLQSDGTFELHARTGDTSTRWCRHMTGAARAQTPPTQVETAVADLTPLPTAAIYDTLAQGAVRLGPAFRRIESLRASTDVVEALLDPADLDWARGVHPVYLDAAWQSAGALVDARSNDVIHVPVSVDDYGCNPNCGVVRKVVLRRRTPDSMTPEIDVDLFDRDGALAAWFRGVRFAATRAEVVLRAARRPPIDDDVLYSITWAASEPPSALEQPGQWIVTRDTRGFAPLIVAELVRCGATARLVDPENIEVGANLIDTGALDRPDTATDAIELLGRAIRILQSNLHQHRVCFVTTRAQHVPGDDAAIVTAHAPLWGIARVAHLEHPRTECAVVDIDEPTRGAARCLVRSLLATNTDRHYVVRSNEALAPRIERLPPVSAPVLRCRPDATYLITGGTGALGLHTARALAQRGARHLTLVARTPASNIAQVVIDELTANGVEVTVAQADVADEPAIARVVRTQSNLRGVVHTAGVLDDGVIDDLTPLRLANVCRPKVFGARNLDTLTRDCELDFFVMYSAAGALYGSAGQASYVAANTYLDALAHERRARGLCATSIAWGPWSGGGMATRTGRDTAGLTAMSPDASLAAFDRAVASQRPHVAVMSVDWSRVAPSSRMFENLSTRRGEVRSAGDLLSSLRRAAATPQRALQLLRSGVRAHVASVLGLESPSALAGKDRFFDLGMDSLMVVELRNRLSADLDTSLAATLVLEYPNLDALTDHLAQRTLTTFSGAAARPDVAADRILQLDDDDADALLDAKLDALELD